MLQKYKKLRLSWTIPQLSNMKKASSSEEAFSNFKNRLIPKNEVDYYWHEELNRQR